MTVCPTLRGFQGHQYSCTVATAVRFGARGQWCYNPRPTCRMLHGCEGALRLEAFSGIFSVSGGSAESLPKALAPLSHSDSNWLGRKAFPRPLNFQWKSPGLPCCPCINARRRPAQLLIRQNESRKVPATPAGISLDRSTFQPGCSGRRGALRVE